jgi:predicted metal-dependent HD superfamily phosphohydrolase
MTDASDRLAYLRPFWDQMVGGLGSPDSDLSDRSFQNLIQAYREPHRRYHTTEHLAELCRLFEDCRDQFSNPSAVLAAIFYHDVVYRVPADPGTSNEQLSAEYADVDLAALGFLNPFIERIHQLILATLTHKLLSEKDSDAALFLDMDMSVLGRDPVGYRIYIDQIRDEYSIIPDELFYAGRMVRFLVPTLESERIFWSDFFHSGYESRARENLAGECSAIQKMLAQH